MTCGPAFIIKGLAGIGAKDLLAVTLLRVGNIRGLCCIVVSRTGNYLFGRGGRSLWGGCSGLCLLFRGWLGSWGGLRPLSNHGVGRTGGW